MKRRKSAKKEQLVRAGRELFARFGLKRATVEDICREAGVSKMTYYKHFSNKLDLFKHIWSEWSDGIFERLEEMEKEGASFPQKMQAIVEYKVKILSEMDQGFVEDMLHAGPELEAFINELRMKSVERFFEFVAGAQEKGEMREIKPQFLLALLDLFGELSKNDALRRIYPSDTDFVRELNDFFFFGIMPSGDRQEISS